MIYFTSWFSNISGIMGKGKGVMVKSGGGFGDLLGMRRKHLVVFAVAKCLHTTAI